MTRPLIAFALYLFALSKIAFPQGNLETVSTVTLERLMAEMLANNQELNAARLRWEAMQKRPGQERALPDPKLGIGWASAGNPLPGFGIGTEPAANIGFTVSQEIPFPGKRVLRAGMARSEAEAEASMYIRTELDLVNRLRAAYYELQFVYDSVDVLARNQVLLERLARIAESRYSVGEASQQDLIKSQVEVSILEARQLDLERRRLNREADINALLNRRNGSPVGKPLPVGEIPVLPTLESVRERAFRSSPMLRTQRFAIDGRQLAVQMARREYYPDFEVMGGYFNQGSMKDMWEFRFQMSVPLYFASRQRPALEEANIRLREAQVSYRSQEQTLAGEIENSYHSAEISRRLMDLYSKSIVPQSTLALESSLASYGTGNVDFLSVLTNFLTILENEMNYYEQRTEYLKALSELEELAGGSVN